MRKRVFIIVFGIILSLIALYAIFVVLVSGGIKKTLVGFNLGPKHQNLTKERDEAIQQLTEEQEAIAKNDTLTYYDKSTHDVCYKGQYNFKIKDNYAYKCSYSLTYFYGFNGDFRTTLLDLEKEINKEGWKNNSLTWVINEYYDKRFGPNKLESTVPNTYPETYMPPAAYKKSSMLHRLEIIYTQSEATQDSNSLIEYQQRAYASITEDYDERKFVNVANLVKEITKENKYVLVVSIEKSYFTY